LALRTFNITLLLQSILGPIFCFNITTSYYSGISTDFHTATESYSSFYQPAQESEPDRAE